MGDDDPFEDLYLVDRGGPRVLELLNRRIGTTYATLAEDAGTVLAGSIAEFVCVTAMRRYVLDPMPSRVIYGQAPECRNTPAERSPLTSHRSSA